MVASVGNNVLNLEQLQVTMRGFGSKSNTYAFVQTYFYVRKWFFGLRSGGGGEDSLGG